MRSDLGAAGHWSTSHLHLLAANEVDHAMSCTKGGFFHRRHDDVRDLFASLFKDVCHDIEVEPHLYTLTGDVLTSSANFSDEARLEISAHSFWQRGKRAFCDVRVLNPFAKSHLNHKLNTAFSSNENEKKQQYNQRSRTWLLYLSRVLTVWRKWLRSRTISHWTTVSDKNSWDT